MKWLDANETRALLPFAELVDALREVLQARREGRAYAPLRASMPLPGDAALLLMPAADQHLAITKVVTVHPLNGERGLPFVQADVLVFDAPTGRRLLMLDGGVVTARRTAALSLLAASLLAPDPEGALFIVGAGVQARAHLEAFMEGLGVREVYVASRTLAKAEEVVDYGARLGATARLVTDPAEALERSTLIVTATTSASPVLPDAVRDDAFIAAVGAYTDTMAELPASLVARSRIFVDTIEGCRAEAGDLIQAGVDWSQVTALEDALDGPRPIKGPAIYKSVGSALWDLAAASLAVRRAVEQD